MQIREEENGDDLALNLTPMIDVVFLLLVFFMVATTFLDPEREINIDLPPATSAERPLEEQDEIVINVGREGDLHLGGRAVSELQLDDALEAAAQRDPNTPVTIRGDRLVAHERVVGVMDACGRAGLRNLAVGTLERQGG